MTAAHPQYNARVLALHRDDEIADELARLGVGRVAAARIRAGIRSRDRAGGWRAARHCLRRRDDL